MLVLVSCLGGCVHFLYRIRILGKSRKIFRITDVQFGKNLANLFAFTSDELKGIPKYLELEDMYIVEISVAFVLRGPLYLGSSHH